MRRSPFGTWCRKLCGEAGLEDSIISNKMRKQHIASRTVIVWLLIVVNWWNNEFTGETGPHGSVDEFNNHLLVWFEIVLINHSSQRAKKVVSNSLGLVDFAIGLVNSVFNLPDGQVMFYEEFE